MNQTDSPPPAPTIPGQRAAGMDWFFWRDNPPPKATKIQARYSLSERWMEGETCNGHFCLCFYVGGNAMTRPNFWRYQPEVSP